MPIREVVRDPEMRCQTTIELAVPIVGLLVQQEIPVVLGITRVIQRATVDSVHPVDQGAPGRWRLKSELGAESRNLTPVGGVVNLVPDLPLMVRAMVGIVGMDVFAVRAWGVRAVVAVWSRGIELGDNPRKKLVGIPGSPSATAQPGLPVPIRLAPQILIAAVEQHQGRMGHQSHNILTGLGFDLLPKRRLLRVCRAGQQEVLPNQQALLVARLIEVVALEDATAPDPNHVHVDGESLVEPTFHALGRDPGQKVIIRDPVDTFDEQRLAVDRKGERGAALVASGVQFDRAEPNPPLPSVEFLIVC